MTVKLKKINSRSIQKGEQQVNGDKGNQPRQPTGSGFSKAYGSYDNQLIQIVSDLPQCFCQSVGL